MAYPDNIAVTEDSHRCATYAQLWDRASRVAEYLRRNAASQPFIGLQMPKSISYIIGLLGVWMADKAFIPIGNDLPTARQRHIIEDANLSTVLDETLIEHTMACPAITYTAKDISDSAAYMIYSSGTTGNPKGILVGHAGLCNLASCQRAMFQVDEHSRFLFFLSINFDASISDILVTLTSAATLVIETMPQEEIAFNLFDIISSHYITHTDIPPSLLRLKNPTDCPPCLQTIVIGGEAANIETVRQWSDKVRLINVYGPTEATVCTSMCLCTSAWDRPLLGDVLDNTSYNIHSNGNMNADEGELWISGIGLAIGYYHNEELIKQKFPVINGTRYYRTSDYVRRSENGEIEFLYRIDRQIKYHGQLIEPEEIESVLRTSGLVKYTSVIKRSISSSNNKKVLVAFTETIDMAPSTHICEQQLRLHCQQHLPKWMIPSFFVFMDKFPLGVTGKPDMNTLYSYPLHIKESTHNIRYANRTEELIAVTMAEILKLPAIAPDDDFYLLGGDSLDTLLLLGRLQRYNIFISANALHQNATPRRLSSSLCHKQQMVLHSNDLRKEWQYTAHHHPTITGQSGGKIFITGATGFLGIHLLAAILDNDNNTSVICLVRASSPQKGMERIADCCRQYKILLNNTQRIEVVCGDMALSMFGLGETEYLRVCNEVSRVFHCAATVNMLASYDELKENNVTGTRNIIDFCLTGNRKRLHYASTLSVFVSTDRNTGVAYENDTLESPTNIYGGYGQTKFVAEKMVLSIPADLCDVQVFRFGLLCGDTRHGISSPKDFIGMFIRGAKAVGQLPYDETSRLAVDITPIDIAVSIFAEIAEKGGNGVYHIASENPLMYDTLCQLLMIEDIINSVTEYNYWKQQIDNRVNNADVYALTMGLCRMDPLLFDRMRYMDLFQTTGIRFDMTNTHAITDTRCTQNDELIKKYIRNYK